MVVGYVGEDEATMDGVVAVAGESAYCATGDSSPGGVFGTSAWNDGAIPGEYADLLVLLSVRNGDVASPRKSMEPP